jgi:hypothetical protein
MISVLKVPFGILYTASVYSGSMSYSGLHRSAQHRFSIRIPLLLSLSCNPKVAIDFNRLIPIILQYFQRNVFKTITILVSSRYARFCKALFASRPFRPTLQARYKLKHILLSTHNLSTYTWKWFH